MSRRFVCVMVVGAMSLTGCGATVQTFPSEPDGAVRADAAQPDATQPDATQPDATQPDATQPDVVRPDVGRSDAGDPDAAPDAADADVVLPDIPFPDVVVPRTCTSTTDCPAGETCLGGDGCSIPWHCGPSLGRPCTDDDAAFCGCDGVTFYGSSTCPPHPYDHLGPCGVPLDGGPRPGCTLPDGSFCPLGGSCPWDCNFCLCTSAGLRCTTLGCTDGGPPPPGFCATDADCVPGTLCTGTEGCGTPRFCVPAVGCAPDAATFCGCDGVTFTGSSTCPARPYAHLGACRSVDADAGPDACVLPDGTRCPAGETCPLDRCTTCHCGGAGVVSCETNLACLDGGVVDAGAPPPIDF